MGKRGRLTEIEWFFIKHNLDGLTVEEIAEKLDRTIPTVEKAIDTIREANKEIAEEVSESKAESQPKPQPEITTAKKNGPVLNLMGRHTVNDVKVATVMTQAASELADSTRPTSSQSQKLKNAIHKPLS